MPENNDYSINLNTKFDFLELIDIPSLVDENQEEWYNQTLCKVNDCVVRLGIMQGEFHWHKHDAEDEFFFVLQGKFVIEFKGETISLEPQQGFTIPKGVLHRTSAPEKTVILMVEGSSIEPTGD